MRIAIVACLSLGCGIGAAHASARAIAVDCPSTPSAFPVPRTGEPVRVTIHADNAWLRIAESGQDLIVQVDAEAKRVDLQVPPRYGVTWLQLDSGAVVTIARTLPGDARGQVTVSLECEETRAGAWERSFASVATANLVRGAESEVATRRAAIDAMAVDAPDAISRAWVQHVEAQMLLLNERTADGVEAFERAELAWRRAGDPARASAARVALAEDLQRSGKYDDLLELAAAEALDADRYFATRLQATRCLALRSLARTSDSLACFDRVLARFTELGEELERTSALQDYALLLADLDRLDDSEALARGALGRLDAFRDVPGAGVPTVRGRTHLLLADISLRRGDISSGLRECDEALSDFTRAQATRWQGNALLRVAEVYAALGITSDAIAAAEQAQSLFSPRDAPTRVAAAALVRARLELARRDWPKAQSLAAQAAEAFEARKSPVEAEAARIVQLTARLRGGELIDAQSLPVANDANALARQLLLVESDLATGELMSSASRLDGFRDDALAPPARIEVDRLRARWHDLQGEHTMADVLRWRAATRLVATANQSRSAVLRDLLVARIDPIRRDAYAALLTSAESSDDAAERALEWSLIDSARPLAGEGHSARAAGFDSLLARELLPYGGSSIDRVAGQARAQSLRALLAYLAESAAGNERSARDSRPRMAKPVLGSDDAIVALLDGGERLGVLFVDADGARILQIHDRAAFRSALENFAKSAYDPATPLAMLESSAALMGTNVFESAVEEPPGRLFVLGDGGFDAVPWAMVRGPGGQPLVETTNVVLVTRANVTKDPERPVAIDVLVADAASPALPPLASATTEARQVTEAIRDSGIRTSSDARAGRDRILDALEKSRTWVHVAAHGITEPRRLGRSGIWTTAGEGEDDEAFLSWLDPLARGVGADLVVLNACALARGETDENRPALNFAAAVSRAGARDVVAVMWPISDTASAIWIPAFYDALLHGSLDVADATRTAQRALRDTRRFRHPAHWAGLVHLGELPLAG